MRYQEFVLSDDGILLKILILEKILIFLWNVFYFSPLKCSTFKSNLQENNKLITNVSETS